MNNINKKILAGILALSIIAPFGQLITKAYADSWDVASYVRDEEDENYILHTIRGRVANSYALMGMKYGSNNTPNYYFLDPTKGFSFTTTGDGDNLNVGINGEYVANLIDYSQISGLATVLDSKANVSSVTSLASSVSSLSSALSTLSPFNAAAFFTDNASTSPYIASSSLNGFMSSSSKVKLDSLAVQVPSDWNQTSSSSLDFIKNKPSLATVATSGLYNDLSGKPSLATVATSGAYSDLSGKPSLSTVATSGAYTDLTGKPTLGVSYEGTTQRSSSFPIFKTATVSSGTVTFNLTNDGTSGGTALFPNGVIQDSVNLTVNDATAAYQMSWAWSNSNKTLTVTANKLTTANILTGILGQAQANSSVVKLSVWGY